MNQSYTIINQITMFFSLLQLLQTPVAVADYRPSNGQHLRPRSHRFVPQNLQMPVRI